MSSTNRGTAREPDDFYATPAWCTRAILPHLRPSRFILDPFAGKGAILDAADDYRRERWRYVRGIELDRNRAGIVRARHLLACDDTLGQTSWDSRGATVVTNPPYSRALECVERAIAEVGPGGQAAFLLRIAFLASQERAPFHRAHPSDIYVLDRRPSFAASIACKVKPGKRAGCGWRVLQEIDALRPKTCPKCGLGGLDVTTTDSADYAWFVWPGQGRWSILDTRDIGG